MDQSFKKEERLQSKKIIDLLFEKGMSFAEVPIRTIWLSSELKTKFPVQVLIAVPKKNIAKAVQRNQMKRRMREAYRKHKHILYQKLQSSNKTIALALVFTGREVIAYPELEEKIILSLQRLADINEVDTD